jgi:hypothetical protein
MKKMNPVVHFEMPYEDKNRMIDFYAKAFGWKSEMMGEEYGNYVVATTSETDENRMVKKPGTINGGFFPKEHDPEARYYPRVVIAVDDIQEAMKEVNEAGGRVEGEPMDIPNVGKYVFFTDTEGNRASMMQMK